jgi:hypothetical protein
MCLGLREKANEDPTFISRIIMGEESWTYGYDPETMQHLSQWTSPQSPRTKKTRQVRSSTKSMFIVFFLTWRGLFTMNLFLLTLRSTLTFTVTFWDAWEKMCDEKDWNFPLWFCFVSQIENETEEITFWNSVWHPKGITRGTRQH